MYVPRFIFPWALVLTALVPWTIYVGWKIRSLAPARKWTALALRCLILLCLIGALAGAELVKRNDKLAVFFLLDHSNSIPEDVVRETLEGLRESARQYMTPRDESGLIVFGEEASIELRMGPDLTAGDIRSYVGGEQTDVAAAIRLAMAAFPQGSMKRIVLCSDGNETRGSALEEIKLAQAAGVAVDVVPLPIGGFNEVRVRELTAPGRVNGSEPFQLRAVVQADQDCQGTLRLFRRTAEGKRLLAEQAVTLQKGDNSFVLPQELDTSGFYEYAATIESDADTVQANNEAQTYTIIEGEPRVLYVNADPQHDTTLVPALRTEGLEVTEVDLGRIPASLAEFQNYSVVVLSNVSSTDLGGGQLKALEAMVRDLGIGLVMIGGPDSFGAGGYQNTAVEKALPVSMDIKQRKILPRGALVVILHTCEIQDGNAWARDIGLAALNVLASRDLMGALIYGYNAGGKGGGEDWLFPLEEVGDRSLMKHALQSAQPGDMPDVGTTLNKAAQALQTADAAVKRVVIISDGDPAAPTVGLLDSLAAAKISVSTVCIAPHSPSDQGMLQWIAKTTKGNYYYVTNPNRLPQIFTKEASVVKRGLLVEKKFTPQLFHGSELLTGLLETGPQAGAAPAGLPPLLGYVVTSPKEGATIPLVSNEKDPVLATWRYGLGKSVAFTSDVTSRWAPEWLAWPGFNRFWAQTVRWAMREVQESAFRIDTRVKEGMGSIRIDAVDDQGKFVNFLQLKGVVTGPEPDFKRQELTLLQTAPGIYEGTFPLDNSGVHMINLTYERGDGTRGALAAGLALSYSREYEYNTTNVGLLDRMALLGGGKIRSARDNPFRHDLPISATITSIWPYLVALAACLFPIEIFVRRMVLDFGFVFRLLARLLRWIPILGARIRIREWHPATVTGTYGRLPAREYAPATFDTQTAQAGEAAPAGSREGYIAPEGAARSSAKAEATPAYTRQLLAAKERAIKKHSRGKDEEKRMKDEE